MFKWLGRGIAHRPGLFALAWLCAIAAGVAWSLHSPPVPPGEVGSFLPPDSPHNQAVGVIKKAFPELSNNSYIAMLAYRPGGLSPSDMQYLGWLGQAAGNATENRVLSPSAPFLRQRLVSHDGEAALTLVNLSSNFISEPTIKAVERVEELTTKQNRPGGLTIEFTGTAGIGRDYFLATRQATERTTWVTISAVLIILVIVYRSPIGALVPLVSIGASAYLAFVILNLLTHVGWQVSPMEKIFAVVLIFGAGVDYALFWIARYRESLGETSTSQNVNKSKPEAQPTEAADFRSAANNAMIRTGPAILASAATTICGLSTMLAADLAPSRHAGRVLAIVLLVALIAALTLVPALARLLGRWLFWPMGATARPGIGQRLAWPWLADRVTRRPLAVLAAGAIALTIPALMSLRIAPRFDSLSELPKGTSSWRGFELAQQHFSKGQLYSNNVLLRFPKGAAADLNAAAREMTAAALAQPGVLDVYSLSSPLGKAQGEVGALAGMMSRSFYQSSVDGEPVLRFEVLIDHLPFAPEAIVSMKKVMTAASQAAGRLGAAGQRPQVMLAGPTGYIIGVQQVATHDQRVVMLLATAVITVIVLMMVRNVPLTLFMVLTTWLTYGATLTISDYFFVNVMHTGSLDWKVRLILFVIVVAVGQDYNIFLVSRLLGQQTGRSQEEHVREAIIRTGSVISSCGIIMAATLGSLYAGRLVLLEQLGVALALGILIDTFFVRPLLIPSFYLAVTRRPARASVLAQPDAGAPTLEQA